MTTALPDLGDSRGGMADQADTPPPGGANEVFWQEIFGNEGVMGLRRECVIMG